MFPCLCITYKRPVWNRVPLCWQCRTEPLIQNAARPWDGSNLPQPTVIQTGVQHFFTAKDKMRDLITVLQWAAHRNGRSHALLRDRRTAAGVSLCLGRRVWKKKVVMFLHPVTKNVLRGRRPRFSSYYQNHSYDYNYKHNYQENQLSNIKRIRTIWDWTRQQSICCATNYLTSCPLIVWVSAYHYCFLPFTLDFPTIRKEVLMYALG